RSTRRRRSASTGGGTTAICRLAPTPGSTRAFARRSDDSRSASTRSPARAARPPAASVDGNDSQTTPEAQEFSMSVERAAGGTSLIDVLDRVLDKGIVIDAWVRVSLVGIDLITVEARVVVASIDTYLKYSEAVGQVAPVSRPAGELASHQNVVAENAAL